jgi:dihydroorotate dehydrogenase
LFDFWPDLISINKTQFRVFLNLVNKKEKFMIVFSNGWGAEHFTGSGAMAFDGWGWPWEQPLRWLGLLDPTQFTNVIKTLTMLPRKGNLRWYNPLGCIRPMRGGAVNAVGLTNLGINWWMEEIGPDVDSEKNPLVGSILGELDELVAMAKMLNRFDLVALEINASCPNTEADILKNAEKVVRSCRMVKRFSRFPLILKLSVVHDLEKIVKAVEGIVEAFSINSVPWNVIFPDKKSPLAKLGGGGVSGKIAQPFTWPFAKRLAEMSSVPVIGPGVWDFGDPSKLRALGCKAVSFASVFLCHPWSPNQIVKQDLAELEKEEKKNA